MREARKFKVPDALANLYEFANTLDLRRFTHHGVQHPQGDELRNPDDLAAWMRARGLAAEGTRITPAMLGTAHQLRSGLRAYLARDPDERRRNKDALRSLNKATRLFPLLAEIRDDDGMVLAPAREDALAGLSHIVAELYDASASGALNRLKLCASDECQRAFFDRSKPGSRRWCVSTLCGNRMKTRAYRERHQGLG
jgi:predicted RNA-binding Zn ribbon-like protein